MKCWMDKVSNVEIFYRQNELLVLEKKTKQYSIIKVMLTAGLNGIYKFKRLTLINLIMKLKIPSKKPHFITSKHVQHAPTFQCGSLFSIRLWKVFCSGQSQPSIISLSTINYTVDRVEKFKAFSIWSIIKCVPQASLPVILIMHPWHPSAEYKIALFRHCGIHLGVFLRSLQ